MLFQTLDEKENCVATYIDGKLTQDILPNNLSKTWRYSAFLRDMNVEYANLYCGSNSLSVVCPDDLLQDYKKIENKLKAFYRSFKHSKISLDDNCFFDMVPERYLLEYCHIKNVISEHVFSNYEKPKNYQFLVELSKLVTDIKYRKLNVDVRELKDKFGEARVRKFIKKIQKTPPYIKYNIFGTKTGRLSGLEGSFPIMTMDKNYRKILKPNNHWFVELDYNAAELRTFLALSGRQQPQEDLHDWNVKNVYRNLIDRDEAKKRIFAWLYNPESRDFLSNKKYGADRENVKRKFWDGTHIETIHGRRIESDEYHALNYIIQSTLSDMVLKQAFKIKKFLEGRKTEIAFTMHDSIVLDMHHDDEAMIEEVFNLFQNTQFGVFKANAHAGRNYGDLKELWIK